MSTVTIQHLGKSSLAGGASEFEGPVVRLGRQPDNDVVFDAQKDVLVSGRHAEVSLDGQAVWVSDLGSRNGVFVNGERVQRRRAVGPQDRVSLGRGGPEFRVLAGGGAGEADGLQTVKASGPGPRGPGPIRVFGGAAAGPATPAAVPLRRQEGGWRAAAMNTIGRLMAPRAQASGGGVGMNTIMRVVSAAERAGRRRTLLATAPAFLLLAAMLGAVWLGSRKATDWRGVAHAATDSVYVVIVTAGGGSGKEVGLGTAWSAAPGYLATNAHVAEEFEKVRAQGATLVARTGGVRPVELRIVGVTIHPGYGQFAEMMGRYQPKDLSSPSGLLEVPPACDVALLHVEPADVPRQGRGLTIAPASALEGLAEQSEILYLGFPGEGNNGGRTTIENPTATSESGGIRKVCDEFLGACEPGTAAMLAYNINATGGGSGGPVLDAAGRVVGLLSSGDVVGRTAQGRIPLGGFTYGPRADLVRELLEKTAEKAQEARAARWEARLRRLAGV